MSFLSMVVIRVVFHTIIRVLRRVVCFSLTFWMKEHRMTSSRLISTIFVQEKISILVRISLLSRIMLVQSKYVWNMKAMFWKVSSNTSKMDQMDGNMLVKILESRRLL